jgi:hypothetical protein
MIEQLKQFHETSGLTWYRIAKDLGAPYQTIYNWRNGKQMSPVYKKIVAEYVKRKSK